MHKPIFPLLIPLLATLLLLTPSCKDDKGPDFDRDDEIARLQAYQTLHFPGANTFDDGSFIITLAEGTGATIEPDQWLIFDYVATDLDAHLLGTSIRDSAAGYGHKVKGKRYAPIYREFTKKKFGNLLHQALNGMKAGSIILAGVPSFCLKPKDMWTSQDHVSALCTLIPRESVADPKAREQARIQEYLANHPDYEQIRGDSIQRWILSVGKGLEVTPEMTVWLQYAGYFLDGTLFDTNIKEVAQKHGLTNHSEALLAIRSDGSSNLIDGFQKIAEGLHIETEFRVLIPSSLAYGAEGKNEIDPYEPLLFEIKIVRAE